MKLRSLILPAFLALALLAPAAAQNKVHDVDITVTLATDGSARIQEVWDMTLSKGTEVYLGRTNLGDIEILDLTVTDDKGVTYTTDRHWNTDRSFEQKKNHCGLNTISGGYEICWGMGEYGNRTYTVNYTLTNLVKSLDDYDMIHYLFYTPNDLHSEHVKVTIEKPGFEMDTLTRIWAFGFYGRIWREDGKVITESESSLEPDHQIIVLMRFDKGTFESKSVQERPFQVVLDRALEGADEPDDPLTEREELIFGLLGFLLIFVLPVFLVVMRLTRPYRDKKRNNKKFYGVKNFKGIEWSREIPYDGDILKNYYVIQNSSAVKSPNNSVASAMILHMLQQGALQATRDLSTGKVDIHFNDKADFSKVDHTEESLWSMMYEASGDNHILEEKEFSKWAEKHKGRLISWTTKVLSDGLDGLRAGKYYGGISKFTAAGQAENRKIIGFKKFLEDTTLIKIRSTPEVTLWQKYLIFASLVGIADKVAKELKDIDPVMFQQAYSMAYTDMTRVINLSNSFSRVVSTSTITPRTYSTGSLGGFSRSGGGGFSSFGGGGGFSGGGHSGTR